MGVDGVVVVKDQHVRRCWNIGFTIATALGLLLSGVVAGCAHRRQAARPAQTDPEERAYLRLVVALGERDPDSIDYYYGPEQWVTDIRKNPPTLVRIRQTALQLVDHLQREQPGVDSNLPQREFLARQLRAIASRADLLLGMQQSFDRETELLFGVRLPLQTDEPRLARVRAELAQLLPGKGDLAQRYMKYEQTFVVPQPRLRAVMSRALAGCRDETLRHVPLPRGEQVTVSYVHNKPWSGFSRYQGNFHSAIQVNTDFPRTVDQILQLACHEGYPGHHVYNSIRESYLVDNEHMTRFMAQPTFSPQSLASEAAATFAVEVAFPWPDRVKFERDVLFPIAGISPSKAEKYGRVEELVDKLHAAEPPIARDYLDGRLEFVRAEDALASQALMAQSEATLKYINEYRTYMITYTVGRDMVASVVGEPADGVTTEAMRWQSYLRLITNLRPLQEISHQSLLNSRAELDQGATGTTKVRPAKRM